MLEKQTVILNQLFDKFNEMKFNGECLKPVITVQTNGRRNCYGWCTVHPIWINDKEESYYEINIAAEHMGDGLFAVMDTLLHEMVHLYNLTKGIKDCCATSQYHNTKFRDAAQQIGLVVEKTSKYGYAATSLSEELREEIKELNVEDVFTLKRGGKCEDGEEKDTPQKEKKKRKKNKFTYTCATCGNEVVAKIKGLRIICQDCNAEFIQEVIEEDNSESEEEDN